MSREIDYNNLTTEDITYLRDRHWLPQPDLDQLEAVAESDHDDFAPAVAEETPPEPVVGEGEGESNPHEPVVNEEPTYPTGDEPTEGEGDSNAEPIIEETDDGLDKLTVAELKKRLKKAKLPVSGNHGELVDRLRGSSWT